MSPTVASAFLAMGTSTSRDEAQRWANEAARRGATPTQLADAWHAWDAEADASVQLLDMALSTRPDRCACTHGRATHGADGECWSAACGCAEWRPAP